MKIKVTCPFDESLLEELELHSQEDAESMLDNAYNLYSNRSSWLEHHERVSILKKLASLVEKEADDFALLIASEGGKPLLDAKVEVARAIDGINLAAKELMHVMKGEEIPMGYSAATVGKLAFTTCEPIGVVLAISAFNHPLNLIIHQIIPAIIVGCPVIVKPASSTPLNCIKFVELVHKAGLPKDWCQYILCENKVAEFLVSHKKVAFFSFIGSGKIGWYLRSKLADGTRCALEHGGVAPVIVENDVNIADIIAPLVKGGFYHAGQVCVSVQKIFAHKNIARNLAEEIAKKTEKLIVGDARNADTEVGPLISPKEVDRVHNWVMDAKEKGAEILTGGKKISATTYAPTVIFNATDDAIISQNEIFGPVVIIYEYENRDDAIKKANSLDFAFQAAVFSNDVNTAMQTAKQINASAVMINDHTAFRCDWMPFAGRKSSGYGTGGIGHTMHDMVQAKMIVMQY